LFSPIFLFIMWYFIIGLVALAAGCIGTYLMLRSRLAVTQEINQKVKKENEDNLALKARLVSEVESLETQKSRCQNDINSINFNIQQAQTNLSGLNNLLKENTAAIDETTKR